MHYGHLHVAILPFSLFFLFQGFAVHAISGADWVYLYFLPYLPVLVVLVCPPVLIEICHVLFVVCQPVRIIISEAVIVRYIGGNLWIMFPSRRRRIVVRIIGVLIVGKAGFP